MTKKLLVLSIAVIALTATASLVMAQGPGGPGGGRGPGGPGGGRGPGGPGGGMMMGAAGVLMNEDARKELGITDDQEKKLTEARDQMRASFAPPQGGPGQRPDPAQMAQMREQMQKMQTEMRANIEKILNKDQVEKLDVMVFQRSGGLDSPMANNETLRALGLNDEQKKKIDAINEKAFAEMRDMFGAGGSPRDMSNEERQAMRDKMQKSRDARAAEVKAVLTPDQVEKAVKLMDNVPDYLKARPGQGGRGGQGGGFGNYQPGQGGGATNPNREAGRTRQGNGGGRRISGN
ncbi:MAG: hypothetical protein FWC50_11470 [Planctomycetaceae bacterium]|nr:hypothetical protein [Planctomycetaceae bacterium]